ncbi:MAG: RdgB/HAM1 family non-canonical purine NTP pyrophosphatase [Gammaproteobacteria bacterium]|nr:RdgB/HAM1 family non-canonical purine NTP pyrophosphatase [Gammaproteobacteria bacterium]
MKLAGKELVLATGNAGKVREMQALLEPLGLAIRPQSDWDFPAAEETGLTFIENAIIKARHAAEQTGLPALADDSGLEVDALDGAPGIYSSRYAGEDGNAEANIDKLLDELTGVADRNARFRCVIVLLRHPADPMPLVVDGSWEGRILDARQGEGGFGYDPVFQPLDAECAAAELSKEAKNRLSHRGKALQALLDQLR